LPDTIQFVAGHQNYYTYDASGKKLEVQNITSRNILNLPQDTITRLVSSTKLTTDYCGDAIYQNDTLKEVLTPEGYWQNGLYYYYLKDHQGSTREVLRQDNTVMEYSDYYPDGIRFESSTSNSAALPYRYNGKELEAMNGLNEYDYGARRRETGIPVWKTMDPLAEKYYGMSPYAYCAGNPINRIDPDGREWKEKEDEKIAEQLQQQIASRDKFLAKQETSINSKIEKIENNTKLSAEKKTQQIAKQQGTLEDVQAQRTLLSNLDKGITQLGDSKTSYTFNTVEAETTATLSSMSDGTIVINNYGTTGNRGHETTHAIQYDNGQIKFNPLGSNNTLMQNPIGLEIQAYATEYSITNGVVPSSDARYPRTVFDITPQWLYELKDPNTGIYIYRPENYK
jgi:RHS repeat-associated protein